MFVSQLDMMTGKLNVLVDWVGIGWQDGRVCDVAEQVGWPVKCACWLV